VSPGQAILRAAAAGLCLAGPAVAEMSGPAELPPKDYAGQQYVDSKGCLFMRAGPKGDESWIPRVTRKGVPLCDNPPSGERVPVANEDSAASPEEPAPSP
jgi:hypothetical protein